MILQEILRISLRFYFIHKTKLSKSKRNSLLKKHKKLNVEMPELGV